MNPDLTFTVRPNSVAVLDYHDGSAGQIETWFEQATGYHIACFVHESATPLVVDATLENSRRVTTRTEYPTPCSFKDRPLIVATDWAEQLAQLGITKVLPLTPDNVTRLRQIQKCAEHELELVSAIHPSVQILAGAVIAPGVWINAGSLVGYKTEIESGVILNTGVQLDHHNVLERGCHVGPGVVTAGNVTLREGCYVHTGAIIINRIEVGARAVVGAGAVVIANVPAGATVVGVPARIIKTDSP